MSSIFHPACAAAALALLLAAGMPARAAGGGGGGGGESGTEATAPEFTQGVAAIKAERWRDAIALLAAYVQRARNDADGHNWLAYAYRKSGQLDLAFTHYKRALAIDPTHRGAHEYIGEAYLMARQPERADYHLAELARLCAASCEEYQDLRAAITQYRAANGTAATTAIR